MALLPRQDEEGSKEENVADQAADREIRSETDAPLEVSGEEVVGCRTGETARCAAAAAEAMRVGKGRAETGGDVWVRREMSEWRH